MNKRLFERLVESMQQHEEIRAMTGLNQTKFARLLDVDVGTLRNWEQGRRHPTGPARALLRAIKRDPKSVLKRWPLDPGPTVMCRPARRLFLPAFQNGPLIFCKVLGSSIHAELTHFWIAVPTENDNPLIERYFCGPLTGECGLFSCAEFHLGLCISNSYRGVPLCNLQHDAGLCRAHSRKIHAEFSDKVSAPIYLEVAFTR